jgi:hypothetical protein
VPEKMKGEILIYVGAALPFLWGVSHLFPTKSVIRDFGDISADNRNIIAMEWIVTAIDPKNITSTAVYLASSACLVVLAGVSLFTGFKINFMPFRLCPIIFTSSAILITFGWKIL